MFKTRLVVDRALTNVHGKLFQACEAIFKFAFPGKFLQTNRNVRDLPLLLLPSLKNLPICNLFFSILCNLFFVNIVDLFFLIFFGKIFYLIFLQGSFDLVENSKYLENLQILSVTIVAPLPYDVTQTNIK